MNKKIHKIIIALLILIISGISLYSYKIIFKNNVQLNHVDYNLKIYSETTFTDITNTLINDSVLIDIKSFIRFAKLKKYEQNIKTGNYIIKQGMNNKAIINTLISGLQTPVKVTIVATKDISTYAAMVDKQLELDSATIVDYYYSQALNDLLNISDEDKVLLLLPNTYELYWNISINRFWERMKKESDTYWNGERLAKLNKLSFSKNEAVTLASIVERETNYKPERPIIAGVYINRLKKGILLQADPTLSFIADNDSIRRILNKHKKIDSPYNTYIYAGLPPGPIFIPSQNSIDAVLNYKKHDYLFFCADSDFSGKHNFSTSYSQHLKYARSFQRALNKRGVYK